jgi:hypothetical protein
LNRLPRPIVACAVATVALLLASPLRAETNVGVSISVHQPGVYGRIDIGNFPPPPVVYAQPVVIVPSPVAIYQRPVYLYVPPGHQKNWAKHCSRYAACGQPVYFVQERWVVDRYHERRAPAPHVDEGKPQKGPQFDKGDKGPKGHKGQGKPRRDKHVH